MRVDKTTRNPWRGEASDYRRFLRPETLARLEALESLPARERLRGSHANALHANARDADGAGTAKTRAECPESG